jgi:hypothetical protein
MWLLAGSSGVSLVLLVSTSYIYTLFGIGLLCDRGALGLLGFIIVVGTLNGDDLLAI